MTLREHDVALPDGSVSRYLVDESIESAVAVLVKVSHDELLLCRQYRTIVDPSLLIAFASARRKGLLNV